MSHGGSRTTIAWEYGLLAVLVLAMIVDGLDMQLLSLVSPLMIADWGIDKATFGPAMSAALAGMSVGAVAGGWLGDRLGRKTVLVGSVIVFGTATVLVALTSGVSAVAVLRFIGGFAFGATAPNTVSLLTEWLPLSLRAKGISWMPAGTPIGGMIGSALLAGLLPLLGWRGSFVLFGGVSLLMAGAVWAVVPGAGGRLGGHLAIPDAGAGVTFKVTWRFQVGIWLAFFCTTYIAYACMAWVPTLATMHQLPLERALDAMFCFNLAAVLAAVAGGFLITLVGSRRLLPAVVVVTAAGVLLLMSVIGPSTTVGSPVSLMGFRVAVAMIGGSAGMLLGTQYVVLAQGYPAARRASGVGIGILVGRLGGVSSSYFGGHLLGASVAHSGPFYLTMLVAVGGTLVGLALIDRHVPGRATNR